MKDIDSVIRNLFPSPKPHYTKDFDEIRKAKKRSSDAEVIIQETKKTIKAFQKIVNKNKIPKTYDEIMAMRDRLVLEEKQQREIKQAVNDIKELQKRIKENE